MKILGTKSNLSHQVFQRTRGTHHGKDEDYYLEEVNEEASRETKEGQLKGKKYWLERKDTGDLSSYTVTH